MTQKDNITRCNNVALRYYGIIALRKMINLSLNANNTASKECGSQVHMFIGRQLSKMLM